MHEQFADLLHAEMRIGHAPELAGFQRLWTNATNQLSFHHA
jgi:hypothetical protein